MSPGEECAALRAKLTELREATATMEERLARLPFDAESAPMREMMVDMLGKLRAMDQEMEEMLRAAEEHIANSEGGEENGGQNDSQ